MDGRPAPTMTSGSGCVLGHASVISQQALGPRIIPLTPGLPDAWFEHDGQLTKQDIRAVTLATLAPRQGELLWDIGAGSGSVAIEWMLAHPSNRAIAIERDPTRAARIARNAAALGVPDLSIVEGSAPDVLQGLPTPDAVFIGGGATDQTINTAWTALPSGGRIVVNSITIETQAALIRYFTKFAGNLGTCRKTSAAVEAPSPQAVMVGGGLPSTAFTSSGPQATDGRPAPTMTSGSGYVLGQDSVISQQALKTIQIAHADPIGGFNAMRPAMTVTQWSATKP
jgi:precorrin-6Y C5,15-methyltransferase (decarboxylating) CbiT subunit